MTTILHLTDIHFGYDENPGAIAKRDICLSSMLNELSNLPAEWKPQIICITGDLVWRGLPTDYALARAWLDRLLRVCGLSYDRLALCAGNHEVDRKVAGKIPRPSTAIEADAALTPPIAEHNDRTFANFSEFCKSCGIPIYRFGEFESFLVGEREIDAIRFVAFNSSWFSKDNNDKGKLWIGQPHIEYLQSQGQYPIIQNTPTAPLTITLIHHPSDYLHDDESRAGENRANSWDYIATRTHLLLTGHTHGEVRKHNQIADCAYHFTGGATYAGGNYTNSFRLIRIIKRTVSYRSFEYDPRSAENSWRAYDVRSFEIEEKFSSSQVPEKKIDEENVKIETARRLFRADAERQRNRKSRLIKPLGKLPQDVTQEVSLRVSSQHVDFDTYGHLLRQKDAEQLLPIYEAVRGARRTVLLGDLGTGKSALASELVVETIDRSIESLAMLIPVKNLVLSDSMQLRELLHAIDNYVRNEIAVRDVIDEIEVFLKKGHELLLVFDGIDELPRNVAVRLLRQASTIPEHWPNVQIVATARPIELHGVSFSEWKIIHTTSLDSKKKIKFLQAELISEGIQPSRAIEKARELLEVLQELPAFDDLTTTPLAIRLAFPHIKNAQKNDSLTLGDLLYEMLTFRLGNWQKIDDKPPSLYNFEKNFPTPDAKLSLLCILAEKHILKSSLSIDEANHTLMEALSEAKFGEKFSIASEALDFFENSGLITVTTDLDFPLQSLAEVAAAAKVVANWQNKTPNILSNTKHWRVFSFAAAILRRRGLLSKLRDSLMESIDSLLQPDSHNLPAACYIAAEADDNLAYQRTVSLFPRLGMRPLGIFFDDKYSSSRNVAKTIWGAGEIGFTWFFEKYLDPRYPMPHAGSAVIMEVFYQWSTFAHKRLSHKQKEHLSKLVKPYLATGEASFSGILDSLSILTPDEFEPTEKFWHQSSALDTKFFDDYVAKSFELAICDPLQKDLVNKVVQIRASTCERAAEFWLTNNPTSMPPNEVIQKAFQSIPHSSHDPSSFLVSECKKRVGNEIWRRLSRWMLTSPDRYASTGAAILLFEQGEDRLAVLGDTLLKSLHDGGYIYRAEALLNEMITKESDKGIRWLSSKMIEGNDRYGSHSGCWRILLNHLKKLSDGPELLIRCVKSIGPFLIPRYPEVREGFSNLLSGKRENEFRRVLRDGLDSFDPDVRRGAAAILITTDPQTEAKALFTIVQSRSGSSRFDHYEWEAFCLSLNFSPSVLIFLQSRLANLNFHAQVFALALLVKSNFDLEKSYQEKLLSGLLSLGNWHLSRDTNIREFLKSDNSLKALITQVNNIDTKTSGRAATVLEDIFSPLSPELEAKCINIRANKPGWHFDLTKILVRAETDIGFANLIRRDINTKSVTTEKLSLLELVVTAIAGATPWKEVLWELFCNERSYGRDIDDISGPAILEFGLRFERHKELIGQAALECLNDPRMNDYKWRDTAQWLAVIADEFVGLDRTLILEQLANGNPIYCGAATSLLARIETIPEGLKLYRGQRDLAYEAIREVDSPTIEDVSTSYLLDLGRDSEKLHPNILQAIERTLYLETFDKSVLDQLSQMGKPGILMAIAIRFCYEYTQPLVEMIPLHDLHFLNKHNNHATLNRLADFWVLSRDLSLKYESGNREQYFLEIERQVLSDDQWKLPLALQFIRIRKELTPRMILPIFLEFARQDSYLHDSLCIEFIDWIAAEIEKSTAELIIEAAGLAITELNEASWNDEDNAYAYCFFPLVYWIFQREQSDIASAVFLRGIGQSVQNRDPEKTASLKLHKVLSTLEPLIKLAPADLIRETLLLGLQAPDPFLRSFCKLIESFHRD